MASGWYFCGVGEFLVTKCTPEGSLISSNLIGAGVPSASPNSSMHQGANSSMHRGAYLRFTEPNSTTGSRRLASLAHPVEMGYAEYIVCIFRVSSLVWRSSHVRELAFEVSWCFVSFLRAVRHRMGAVVRCPGKGNRGRRHSAQRRCDQVFVQRAHQGVPGQDRQ